MDAKELQKFIKQTELRFSVVEDDSSDVENGGTRVLILKLEHEVTAVASIPLPNGETARLKAKSVKVAGDVNIEAFMKDVTEQDGILIYKGAMHLDVSKPKISVNNATGAVTVRVPSAIFLTKVKFSRLGAGLRANNTDQASKFITSFFGGGKVAEMGSEEGALAAVNVGEGEKKAPEPVVTSGKGNKVNP